MDLTSLDEEGRPWDFPQRQNRERARRQLEKQKPALIVGSPMCTQYLSWQRINDRKRSPAEIARRLAAAKVHMQFVCELYRMQHSAGRFFLHEHPDQASSWDLQCIRSVLGLDDVHRVVGDQCQYGQEIADGHPVKKPKGWMSNSESILQQLSRRCSHRDGICSGPKVPYCQACTNSSSRSSR